MTRPDFTAQELIIVNQMKAEISEPFGSPLMWGYVSGSLTLAFCAAYFAHLEMVFLSFLLLVGFRLYEERQIQKWIPVWHSIIRKYEQCISRSPSESEQRAD